MSLDRLHKIVLPSDIQHILKAIERVTDTFFDSPVTIYRAVDSIDRFNEDRKDTVWVEYKLNCLLEFGGENQLQFTQQGYTEFYDVKCTLFFQDVKAVGLDLNNETILNQSTDYFVVNEKKYKIKGVSLDGPLTQENVLLIILGTLIEQPTE